MGGTGSVDDVLNGSSLLAYAKKTGFCVVPWLTIARCCLHFADTIGRNAIAVGRDALATACAHLHTWQQQKRTAGRTLDSKVTLIACVEDEIVLSTAVGAAVVEYIIVDLKRQLDASDLSEVILLPRTLQRFA
jgi:hypothetical protein